MAGASERRMNRRTPGGTVWTMHLPPPRRWDLVFAVVGTAALIVDGLNRGKGSVASVLALSVLACIPLAWRSRAPLIALLATTAGLVVCLAVFEPYDTAIVALMIALYTVAACGDRRRSLIVGVGTAAFLVAVIVIISPVNNGFTEAALRLVLALGALVVGDTVRTRRALQAADRDRQQRLAREREQDSRRRLADERLRIARDLHDTVAHALVAINVRAGVAAHLNKDPGSAAVLADVMSVSADALDDLRATLSLLREVDDPAPTSPALDLTSISQLLEHAQAAGLDADADVQLNGQTIPSPVEQAGFRIVQEALTNVMRHAAASRAVVAMKIDDDTLHIDVVDDGEGAPPGNALSAGHGLRGMTERAAALGGDVVAGPADDGGWRVHARLPLRTAGRP
jgi:signal transduction histidine kinase